MTGLVLISIWLVEMMKVPVKYLFKVILTM